jgi:four helix bundle protein
MIKAVVDLDVFNLSYQIAMDIFRAAKSFPKEEKYSLTDQIIRSSRSIAANIAEGWGRRTYENEFKKHLIYAMGSLEETKAWMTFARDCFYIDETAFQTFIIGLNELGSKIYKLHDNWKTF